MKNTYRSLSHSLFIVFFLGVFFLMNQNHGFTQNQTMNNGKEWKKLIENESVNINYRYAECKLPGLGTHHENVYLQIINKTGNTIQAEWKTEYWYNGKCNGCEPGNTENIKRITLQAKETKEGFCSENSAKELYIFSKMLNLKIDSELTDFKLRDLKITVLEN